MPEQIRKVIISDGDQELLFLLRNAFVSVGFQVVTVSKNGKKLWETIRNERPDAVICNVFMPHYDVISIMEKLRGEKDINFPVFAILSSFDQDFLLERFLAAGGKEVFLRPTDPDMAAQRILKALQATSGRIYTVDFSKTAFSPEEKAAQVLKRIGMPVHLSGYHLVKMGIGMMFEHPEYFSDMRGLCQKVADKADSTYSRVERNVRTAVETVFERGDIQLLHKIFGYTVSRKTGKPSNIQFMATLYEYIADHTTNGTTHII